MIAMQYSINLPADYDMAIIRRRIADKGHLLDSLPGLVLKAYAYSMRSDGELPARDNLYAPFYVWSDSDGMNAFLCGPGFAGLARDFGRPVVRTWSVWQAGFAEDATAAKSATREVVALPVHAALDECRQTETADVRTAMADGALAAVVAFDPGNWTLVRFRLWPDLRAEHAGDAGQSYRVGHVSQPRHPH
jgi:hypothetical protein